MEEQALHLKIINILGHSFLHSIAVMAETCIDCGANHGEFTLWLSQNTKSSIWAFEPDPRLFAKLPQLSRAQFVRKAVDGTSGKMLLNLGQDRCSSFVYRESGKQERVWVEKVSLDAFCQENRIKTIDLLKLDIEGAELPVLEETSDELLSKTKQITVEFHDFIRKDDVPRIRRAIKRLQALGFLFVRFSHFTYGDCLFLNMRQLRITSSDRLKIILLGKYLPGIQRFLKRHF